MYGGDPSKFAGTAAANVDAFAIAPYFGYPVPDTFTLDQLFTEIMSGGLVPACQWRLSRRNDQTWRLIG